jgi:hypothetical protein
VERELPPLPYRFELSEEHTASDNSGSASEQEEATERLHDFNIMARTI